MKNILLAGAVSMIGTLVGTRWFIHWLAAKGYGQFIRDDGPTTHKTKRAPRPWAVLSLLSPYCWRTSWHTW